MEEQNQNLEETAREEVTKAIKQDFASLHVLGRNLIGISFIAFGLSHFVYVSSLTYMVPYMLPFPALWVILSGLAYIAAGVLLVTERYVYKTCMYLSGFLLLLTVLIYLKPFSLTSIFQNIGFIGGLLLIADRYKE